VATAALGGIAYLVDFAIGASLIITYGWTNAVLAIGLSAVTIFLTSLPLAYYSSRYSIDMDLLTRGAGFGYLGSTITSLIYSFTFIFFALEGAVMAQAFDRGLGIPLWAGCLISWLAIIPLVIFGMTLLSRVQVWTQPIWLILMAAPLVYLVVSDPALVSEWTGFTGNAPNADFDWISMGLGAGIALSLIAQIGEQVDYLRFRGRRGADRAVHRGLRRVPPDLQSSSASPSSSSCSRRSRSTSRTPTRARCRGRTSSRGSSTGTRGASYGCSSTSGSRSR
jgi:purine-cytosine permease-like protein